MNKYRAAVIGRTGHGDYGHGLDEVWRGVPNVELVAVADDDKMGLAAAAKKLGVEQAFSDYREMLDKVKPDFVSIGPRWIDQHRDMVLAAAERGIHMYCEKPLCRTLAEADEMAAACAKTHARLAIAHQTRHSPKLKAVQQLIADGKIGQVLELRGRGKEDTRGGGEDLWVLGTHVMDMMRALGGNAEWCQGYVTQGGKPVTKANVAEGNEGIGPLAGDCVRAMYALAGGATAYFASQRGAAFRSPRFGVQVFGSRGVVEILMGFMPSVKFLADGGWSPARSNAQWQDVSSAGIGKPEPITDGGLQAGNVLAVTELIAAVEGNREPVGGLTDAIAATEMIVAVFESHRLFRPVKFPLENRQNPLTML